MKIRIFNIQWDTDGEPVRGLPKAVTRKFDLDPYMSEEFISEMVSDWLTDKFGYCHFGFEMEIIEVC